MHSHSLYSEVIKVPLIIKFFQSRHAGRKIEDCVRSIDIMPTILEEIGRPYPKKNIDGLSLLGLL
jgi:arylsulfatase A-like enzyme